jgi:hypothetical protein
MITQAAKGQAILIWIEPVLSGYSIFEQNSRYDKRIFSFLQREMDVYV